MQIIGDSLYFVTILIGFLFGGIYLLRSKGMPYHIQALDMKWEEVPNEVKVLCLALMRVSGGGYLAMACSLSFLYYTGVIDSFEGNLAFLIIGTCATIPSLIATKLVKKNTKGEPPVALAYTTTLFIWAGFIFKFFFG